MSEKIVLLPHNEEAYEKLKLSLKDNQMVSINHATGTGKSFILLKYLYENRNKRILYLAPTYPIIEQLIESHMEELGIKFEEFSNFDTAIYSNFYKYNMEEIASCYDIIVLDEYHRCGAKEWGIAINELLSILKEKKSDVKVIGTTATEIRYLDNEKNMNNILFDGECASTLTLADAILKGILPASTYISFFNNLFGTLEKLEKDINRKVIFDSNKRMLLGKVKEVQNLFLDMMENDESVSKYLKEEDAKYLVFSSNIEAIDKDIDTIKRIFKNKDLNIFKIHSGNTKIANKRELDNFRNANKGINILFSVNILNEGVHVKGINAIFMFRETKSPIIYFQQLGRMLSYSSRNKDLVVFDFANNLRNHHVIYELYQEVVNRAIELIKENPEKKEFYENIISKFKILDKVGLIYSKIDDIKNSLAKDNLIELELNAAISILEDSNINEVEKLKARLMILKYYNYLTLSMFSRIQKLNIVKPDIFKMTYEEFELFLEGFKNINEKSENYIRILENKLILYIKENSKIPSMFSKDNEEARFAIEINKNFNKFSIDTKQLFYQVIVKDTNLTIVEKFNYDSRVIFYDEELTYKFIDFALYNKLIISDNYIKLLKEFDNEKSKEYLKKIDEMNKKEEKLEITNSNNKLLFKENKDIYYKMEFIKVMNKYSNLVDLNGIDKVVEDLFLNLYDFVINMKCLPVYSDNKSYGASEVKYLEIERELYCATIIFYNQLKDKGYIDKLYDELKIIEDKKISNNRNAKLEKFISFVSGDFSSMSDSELQEFIKYNVVKEYKSLSLVLVGEELELLDNYFRIYKEKCNELLHRYIDFILVHKRYPILESYDNEEIVLYYFFNNRSSILSKEDKNKIQEVHKKVGNRKLVSNTYYALEQFERENANKKRVKVL